MFYDARALLGYDEDAEFAGRKRDSVGTLRVELNTGAINVSVGSANLMLPSVQFIFP